MSVVGNVSLYGVLCYLEIQHSRGFPKSNGRRLINGMASSGFPTVISLYWEFLGGSAYIYIFWGRGEGGFFPKAGASS